MDDKTKAAIGWLEGLSKSNKAWKRDHASALLEHINGGKSREEFLKKQLNAAKNKCNEIIKNSRDDYKTGVAEDILLEIEEAAK